MGEKRECDGHCDKCNMNQRSYCAAQMAYYNQQEIAYIKELLSRKTEETLQTNIGVNKVSEKTDTEEE